MKITKNAIIELNSGEIESLKVLLDFCTIEDAIRRPEQFPKGYQDYEMKNAYELLDYLRDL